MSEFMHVPDGPPPAPNKRHWLRYILLSGVVFVVALVIVSAALGGSSPKPVIPVNPATSQGSQVSEPAAQATQAPAAAPTPAAPATTALTTSEQQAVESAQSYLDDGQGFSEQGLLQQLTSSYGEGFSAADAAFAIARLRPDWYVQAVDSAKGYISDGEGFSRDDLYHQLTSTDGGEGFTAGQARYALTQVGM